MPRIGRNIEFKEVRIQKKDHEYLHSMKYGASEQLDIVLHRILSEYRSSECGVIQELYQNQIKSTQGWMERALIAEEKLKARNMVLDQVLME